MASDAASSEDLDSKATGEQMLKLWVKEKAALKNFWKDQEPLRKLRTRNIISAAKDSSKLQKAVGRHQLRQALIELQQEQAHEQVREQEQEQEKAHKQPGQQQQKDDVPFCANGTPIPSDSDDENYSQKSSARTSFGSTGPLEGRSNIDGPGEPSSKLHGNALYIKGVDVSTRLMTARITNMSHQSVLHETHDLLSLNFIFTKTLIEHCFQDTRENEIVAQLLKADVPEVPQQDIDIVVKLAIAAASQEYLDFKTMLRGSGLDLSGLAGDILITYTATNALWQDRTPLAHNEDTYIKRSVIPMIDAVFGALEVVQHWQRDQLPVPSGYEEVLQPDFFAEVNNLCFAIMEVKKPNMTIADIEDDTRKLPCMMKIALNMLIHRNVKDPTVLGFLVNENICEVFTLNLEHEAIYIPKSLGRFKLPQNRLDIPALLLALGPLAAAKKIASTMATSIKMRPRFGAGKYSLLTRPSYYVFGSNVPSSSSKT
ncbi:hypothetical protein EMPS_11635 [Entomortierella parvispora]|uniref:Uncharacterized protein n=1 Tax=Entomortierella parvispora TaxID=205924 RepID=A0A9P3HM40_9FUNG|nr:hypothetical protein EMPS_11635 [Entomortierella parvispora]